MRSKIVKNKLNLIYIIGLSCFLIVNQLNTVLADNDSRNEFELKQDWQNCIWDPNKANRLCGGFYKEPKLPVGVVPPDDPEALIIKSDHTEFISKGRSSFTGNVVVNRRNQQLNATKLLVTQNKQGKIYSLKIPGKVKIIEPGFRIIGEDLKVLIHENYKVIQNANYRIYGKHATGDAERIEIFADRILKMPKATYTTCNPYKQTWKIVAKEVKIDKFTGLGQLWHGKLYLNETPIFYAPYLSFPIDNKRHTGFLLPSIDNSSNHGVSFGIPWYWNIASNYDYTFTPYYMSKRGVKLNNMFRYLTNKSIGILNFDFLVADAKYAHKHKLRYGLIYKNLTKLNNNLDLYVKYNKVSDNNYLQDFGKDIGQVSFNSLTKVTDQANNKFNIFYQNSSSLDEILSSYSVHLEQSIKLANINRYGVLNINLSKYQTLYPIVNFNIEEQFKRLPEINWNSNDIKILDNYYLKYYASYTNFKLANFTDLINKSIAQRMHIRSILERPIIKNYGYFKPRVQLDLLSYNHLRHSNSIGWRDPSKSTSRAIPILDVKSGLYFDKPINNDWLQTLEPSLYYLYVPKFSQDHYPIFDSKFIEYSYRQLFLDNRYSGLDRIADAHQVTMGAKTNLRSKVDGAEKMSLAVARTRYLRKLTPYLNESLNFGKWSPIAILFSYGVSSRYRLEADLIMEKLNKVRNSFLNSQFKISEDQILNIGYQYNRFNLIANHQIQTSTVWFIKEKINFLGKLDYDLNRKKIYYALAGVEYNSCCIALRLAISKSLITNNFEVGSKYNNKFLGQIVFKGFTDLGSLEDNCLAGKIPGYKFLGQF